MRKTVELLEAGIMYNNANESNQPMIKQRALKKHITEEIVDVQIVLDQIREYYHIDKDLEKAIRTQKLERTFKRIKDGYYDKKD